MRVAGEIRKIIGYKVGEYIEIYHDIGSASYWSKEGIKELKSSKNIIDLIEVGDIIQYQELAMEEKYGTIVGQIYISDVHDNDELVFIKEEIDRKGIKLLGIVTKEQFASMEYRLEV